MENGPLARPAGRKRPASMMSLVKLSERWYHLY